MLNFENINKGSTRPPLPKIQLVIVGRREGERKEATT